MTMSPIEPEPYASLSALRHGSDELLESLPEDGRRLLEDGSNANAERIRNFVDRVVAAGAVLDTPSERRAAQALIDFWVARSYAMPRDSGAKQPLSGRASILLKPFDPQVLKPAINNGDAVLASLGDKDKDLARRILLQMVRLADASGTYASSSGKRDDLLSLDKPQRVNEVLEALIKAGVLTVTHGTSGDLVSLRYDALMRQWEALRDWIDQRLKFREAALFWEQSGRDRGALLSASLAEEARASGNLNELEEKFVSASGANAFRQRTVGALATTVVLLIVSFLSGYLYYVKEVIPTRNAIEDEKTKLGVKTSLAKAREIVGSTASGVQEKAKAIKLLVSYGEPLRLQAIVLNGADGEVDLRRQESRAPVFERAKLTNVRFDNAKLPQASFTRSTIVGSHFESAILERARFDDSNILSSSFFGANLRSSTFDGAILCKVDFSLADVRSASFRDVKFDDLEIPDFKGTAWWLASGWSMSQVDLFAKKYSHKPEEIKMFPTLVEELKERAENKNKALDQTLDQAIALNDEAWTQAIYGVDLPKAEESVRKAIEILDELKRRSPNEGRIREEEANFNDTLAYILMQNGKMKAATELMRSVIEANDHPEFVFRYALALYAQSWPNVAYAVDEPEPNFRYELSVNEELQAEALVNLKVAIDVKNPRKHSPVHELYLFRIHIKGEFRREMEGLKRGDSEQLERAPCLATPPPQNAN